LFKKNILKDLLLNFLIIGVQHFFICKNYLIVQSVYVAQIVVMGD